jgi:hypothetical protein
MGKIARRYIPGRTPVSKFRSTLPTYHVNTTASVQSVTIGEGKDTTKNGAKSRAATKALDYFDANGVPE